MSQSAENEEVIDDVVDDVEVNETDQETIDLAKSMGWVDEDQFRGDKSRWVDADTFVEKGMNDLPILRERLKAQSNTITTMKSDFEQFKTHHEQAVAREYQRALKEIEDQQLRTVEEGDTEMYQKLNAQKAALARDHQQKVATIKPAQDPGKVLYEEWKAKNSDWFDKDDTLTIFAQGAADKVASEKPELIGTQGFLDEVERRVKQTFPDRFGSNRRGLPTVEAGGRAPARTPRGKKSYGDLPADAKAACDKFVRQGLITREQYVQEFEWE